MFNRAALAIAASLMFAAPALAAETAQEKANIANVRAFYNAALNDKDYAKAEKYLGDRYVQHNPVAADGKEGFKAFIQFLKDNAPNSKSEIKRAFADGDYVILHVHSVRMPGARGNAIFDLFKLENGKVVEHWDAVQPIPETAANRNTMF
jgi:predicted SnoaL-like aldol condensation-catalyzing enzyme